MDHCHYGRGLGLSSDTAQKEAVQVNRYVHSLATVRNLWVMNHVLLHLIFDDLAWK